MGKKKRPAAYTPAPVTVRATVRTPVGSKFGTPIGAHIEELRNARRLSQRDLASALDRTAATVSRWEQGTREPDLATVVKLARLFGVSTDWLLGMEG